MKVVLFCGGLGMRLRDYSEHVPKPMVNVGHHPIIWHLMKYYSHFGHKDFVLCLGYKGEYIKNYFLTYNECLANDFVLSNGGAKVELTKKDIWDWNITFTDTGQQTNIGGRLRAIQRYVASEEVFLANYTDNLSDVRLDEMVAAFLKTSAVAGFLSVRPNFSFHIVQSDASGQVKGLVSASKAGLWSNGGFFVFRQEIFDYIREGEELVEQPFHRLIAEGKLFAYKHHAFWACMDTYKEKQQLDDLVMSGAPPWQVWDQSAAAPPATRRQSWNVARTLSQDAVVHTP
jgi:glucose-1-phosphate cytidylyltransferase